MSEPLPTIVALVLDPQGQWMLRVSDPEDRLVVIVVQDHLPEPERKHLWLKREPLEQLMKYLGPMQKPKAKPQLRLIQGGQS